MTLLLIHAAATLYMAGLIWFVQVVHYPLMACVGPEGFADYESRHQCLTTWVVGPPMLTEMVCAIGLLWALPDGVPTWTCYAGLGLLIVIWLSTAFLQVPRHRELEAGFDTIVHRRLVQSNWLRTIGWTLRGAIALGMIFTAAQ